MWKRLTSPGTSTSRIRGPRFAKSASRSPWPRNRFSKPSTLRSRSRRTGESRHAMKHTLANALFLAVAGLAGSSSLQAQDTIRYLDRKTMREAPPASGSIVEESPAQVVYKPAGAGTKAIAAQDIIDITYDVPASVKLTYRSALADERKSLEPSTKEEDRKKAFNEALKSYQEILAKLPGEKSKFA